MKIVVTGGSGFIGSHLIESLKLNKKNQVGNFDIKLHPNHTLDDPSAFRAVAVGIAPDVIVHLAGQVSPWEGEHNPFRDAIVNVAGTVGVLMAAKEVGAKLIFASTGAVYGYEEDVDTSPMVSEETAIFPVSHYGVSKACAERYVKFYQAVHGLQRITLRFSSVYGPGGHSPVNIFCRKAVYGEQITVFGDGSVTRDYTNVADVVQGIKMAIQGKFDWNRTYNIATGKETSIKQLLATVKRYRPRATVGGKPLDIVYVDEERPGDIKRNYFDISRAKEFGYKPKVTLGRGVNGVINAYQEELGG